MEGMSDIATLQREAERSRQQFTDTLSKLSKRTSTRAISADILAHVEQRFRPLTRLRSVVKNEPVMAAAALLGVIWLIGRVMATPILPSRVAERRKYRSSKATPREFLPTIEKENYNDIDKRIG
jgi:hypothetical protein